MKNILRYMMLVVGILIACSSWIQAEVPNKLEVTVSGTPLAASGIYNDMGVRPGDDDGASYNYWKHESAEYYIYNDNYAGRYWNIDNDLNDENVVYFYSTATTTALNPADVPAWTALDGFGTVTVVEYTAPAPSNQASNVGFNNIAYTDMGISWIRGNGANCAVFMKLASSGTASPVDGTSYTAGTTFGSGSQIGITGWYCVYNGTGTGVTVTGLSEGTIYRVHVCEYNEGASSELYLITSATNNPNNQATSETALPIELASFFGHANGLSIILEWATESETQNLGYIIERQEQTSEKWDMIADYLSNVSLQGKGTTSEHHQYTYLDANVEAGKSYNYRLSDVAENGEITVHAPITINLDVMLSNGIERIYPNPFNPTTAIAYQLSTDSDVEIQVYDIFGHKVRKLHEGHQRAGSYHVYWNGHNDMNTQVSSGSYLIRMQTEDHSEIRKVVLMK